MRGDGHRPLGHRRRLLRRGGHLARHARRHARRAARRHGGRRASDGPPPPEPATVGGAGGGRPSRCSAPASCGWRTARGPPRRAAPCPPDLPVGYHELHPLDGGPVTRLMVTPGRCHLPGRPARPGCSRCSCRRAGRPRAGASATSPTCGPSAPGPRAAARAWWRSAPCTPRCRSTASSPAPTSRPAGAGRTRWRCASRTLPGAAGDATSRRAGRRGPGAQRGPAARPRPGVGRSSGAPSTGCGPTPAPTCASSAGAGETGDELETYARFCALAEHHGRGWRAWPAEHRHPDAAGVAAFAAEHADRVAFWAWVQFLVDDQLRAGRGAAAPAHRPGRSASTPTGPTPGRCRTCWPTACGWARRPTSSTAPARTGACRRSCPTRLRAAGYEPAGLAVAGGDGPRRRPAHRPRDGPVPAVLDPARRRARPTAPTCATGGDELLAVLAIESARAGAVVVGEDLGTVEPEVRDRAGRRRRAVVPAGLVRGRPARATIRPRPWPRSPPTTCPRSPACGRATTPPTSGRPASSPTRRRSSGSRAS